MKLIQIKAPAKINIGLDILSKRIDGFHNLSTLFYPIHDLHDILYIERSDKFVFQCNESSIPNDDSNLVVKAKLILEKIKGHKLNVKIKLNKNIPSQAGLGGGSSDAAATLISLNELFQLGLKFEQLIEIALELGSDVPFFIKAKPAIGTSRGEILEFLDFEIPYNIFIVNPRINISTKEAFMNISPNVTASDYHSLIVGGQLNLERAQLTLKNDFESYVFTKYPEIEKIKRILIEYGAKFSMMSGSGSTVYGIFENEMDIDKADSLMEKHYFRFRSIPLE